MIRCRNWLGVDDGARDGEAKTGLMHAFDGVRQMRQIVKKA
jgi:hypothetical protein